MAVNENSAFTAVSVLANDSDPDGDSLTITGVGTAAHGTASLSGGVIHYMPAANYTGTDTFTYTLSDGFGDTSIGTVTVAVGMFVTSGNTLTVSGTGSATDVFSYDGGSFTFQVAVDGLIQTYSMSAFPNVVFNGSGGTNAMTIISGTAAATVTLNPDSGTFTAAGQTVTVNDMPTVTVNGYAGGTASLYDSSSGGTFVGKPTSARLTGSGFAEVAIGFTSVTAYSASGNTDTADLLAASSGSATLTSNASGTTLAGSGYSNIAVGFAKVYAYATSGASNQVANFYDAAGYATFSASPAYATFSANNSWLYAKAFSKYSAYSTHGLDDVAVFHGSSAGSNVFVGTATYASLTATSLYDYASGFNKVYAYGSGCHRPGQLLRRRRQQHLRQHPHVLHDDRQQLLQLRQGLHPDLCLRHQRHQ